MIRLTAACEDHPDFRFIARLVDRIVTQEYEWTDGILDHCREWRYHDGSEENFLKLSSVQQRYDEAKLTFRRHGFFQGGPGAEYALPAVKVLWLISQKSSAQGVVFLIDADGRDERLTGLQQASQQSSHDWPFRVACGVAHPCREAWILFLHGRSGKVDEGELGRLKVEFGFDPCRKPERLGARSSPKSAKDAYARLFPGGVSAEPDLINSASLSHFGEAPTNLGLAEFTQQVREQILPLFMQQSS